MNVPGLRRLYWSLEKTIVPELRSSQYYYRDKLLSSVPVEKFRWLDLGCGHQVFADWMIAEEQEFLGRTSFAVGLDLDLPSLKAHKGFQAKVCGNLTQIALRDDSFDVITANMVVEHLDQPAVVLGQVHRLLKAGGLFVFHTTNARNPFLR